MAPRSRPAAPLRRLRRLHSTSGLAPRLSTAALLVAALSLHAAACSKAKSKEAGAPEGGATAGGSAAGGPEAQAGGATPAGSGGPAAGGGATPAAMRTYTLFWTVDKEPAGGVKVGIEVPAAWKETVDGMGGPSFTGNGLGHGPDVVLLPSSGADAKARVDALVLRQYDAGALSTAQREDAADGSAAWVSTQRPDGYVDARRFVAAPGEAGVVVCVITLTPAEAARLPELKTICHTLTLLP
jgi:hypothetical protein